MKRLILLLIFFQPIFIFGQDYDWPYESSTSQGQIVGTIGEIRGSGWRFHKGCDLTHTGSTNPSRIYAINDGVITYNNAGPHSTCATDWYSYNSYVKVGDILYIHVKPTDDLIDEIDNAPQGQEVTVSAGDYIGDYLTNCNMPPHCHLQMEGINFLNGHLDPFTDDTDPYFSQDINRLEHGAKFYRNGLLYTSNNDGADLELDEDVSIGGVDHTILYGNIDIAAHIIDPRTSSTGGNGGFQCAPYGIEYSLSDFNGNQGILEHEIIWSEPPSNTGNGVTIPHVLFHPQSVSAGNPTIHIITSDPYTYPYDRWLNTRQLIGSAEDFDLDGARTNVESLLSSSAITKDGPYQLEITGWDADHGSNRKNEVTNTYYLLFDNFKPFVERIEIRNHQDVLSYEAHWELSDSGDGTMTLERWNLVPLEEDKPFSIHVQISEPVSELTLRIDGVNESFPIEHYGNDEYVFQFGGDVLTTVGDYVLDFEGYDLANNALQTSMQYIPYRDDDGTWFDVSDGRDRNHTINVRSESSCTSNRATNRAVTLSCGEGLVDGCNYVDFEVSKSAPAVREDVTFRPTISGTGWDLTWNFGDNAIPTSYQTTYDGVDHLGEATAIFLTEGSQSVSLTLSKAGEEDLVLTYSDCINVGAPQGQMTVDISTSHLKPKANQDITFYSSVSGSSGNLTYKWDFGYLAEYESNSVANPTVAYLSEGVRNVRLTVTDDHGSVTKAINGFVSVEGFHNKIQAIFSPPSVGSFGRIDVTGDYLVGTGDDSAPKTYQWSFGDGNYSTERTVTHYYIEQGPYVLSLKVCDPTGCDTYSKTVNVGDVYPEIVNPNFMINGDKAMRYSNETVIQTPNEVKEFNVLPNDIISLQAVCPSVWLGSDVFWVPNDECLTTTLTVKHEESTGEEDRFRCWVYESGFYKTIIPSANDLGVAPGESMIVTFSIVFNNNDNLDAIDYQTRINVLCGPEVLDYCDFEMEDFTLSAYCWDDTNPITFGLTASEYCGDNTLFYDIEIPGLIDQPIDDPWSLSDKPPYFPYNTTAIVKASMRCNGNAATTEVYRKWYDITIYDSPTTLEVENSHSFCYGASGTIGVKDPISGMSYQWDSSDPDALNFLSGTNIPNPVFSAVGEAATYTYTVTMTESNYGCTSLSETVTVSTTGISGRSHSVEIKVGTNQVLEPPIVGDGSSYTFTWSPETYLSNPRVANPIFTAPDVSENITYTVNAKFRDCESSSALAVKVINLPPKDLEITPETGAIKLNWTDRSLESKFIVERSENGGTFSTLVELPAGTTSYVDAECITPNTEYCYRVKAHNVENNPVIYGSTTYSNTECASPVFEWYESWSKDLDDIYTTDYSFEYPRVGNAFEYGGGDLLFIASTYPESGKSHQNFKFFKLAAQDGNEIVSPYENVTTERIEEYSTAIETLNDQFFVIDHDGADLLSYFNGDLAEGSILPIAWQNGFEEEDLFRRKLLRWGNNLGFMKTTNKYGHNWPEEGGTVETYADIYFARIDISNPGSSLIVTEKLITPHKDGFHYNFFDAQYLSEFYIRVLYEQFGGDIYMKDMFVGDHSSYDQTTKLSSPYDLNDLKLMDTSLVFGTKEESGGDKNIFVGHITGSNLITDQTLNGTPGSQSRVFKVLQRHNNEYLIIATSNSGISADKSEASTGTDIWIISVDRLGNILWEKTIDYPYADKIFEATFIDKDHLLVGGIVDQANHQVNLTMFTSFPNYKGTPNICGTYSSESVLVEDGESITVADGCDATFQSGSFTDLKALNSITLHPGTSIEKGAELSAKVMTTFDSDCLDEYTAGRLEDVSEENEFELINDKQEPEYTTLTVYPNENRGSFNVRRSFDREESYQIAIYSLEGRKVHIEYGRSQVLDRNISINVDIGIYLVELTTSNGLKEVQRVVIKH